MNDVIARLRLLIKREGLELVDFAAELDESPQRIKNILGSRQRMPGEVLCGVVAKFKVDANWLLLGDDDYPMYRQPGELMEPLTRPEKTLLYHYRTLNQRQAEALAMMAEVLVEES